MTAALITVYVLMVALPAGDGTSRVLQHVFASRDECLRRAGDLLAAPRYAGALVLSMCLPAVIDGVEERGT